MAIGEVNADSSSCGVRFYRRGSAGQINHFDSLLGNISITAINQAWRCAENQIKTHHARGASRPCVVLELVKNSLAGILLIMGVTRRRRARL